MNDLFKKLNLLVKSGINDVIGDDTSPRAVDPRQLGKDLSNEVDVLRSRVNEAIVHEESLQKQVETLAAEIENFDKGADQAVQQGKEIEARHILSQMQFAQQRLAMAQSDLQEHQLVTADLIRRVNLLDSVVSEARGKQSDELDTEAPSSGSIQDAMQERMNTLSDMLKTAREKVVASIPSIPVTGDITKSQGNNKDEIERPSGRLSSIPENNLKDVQQENAPVEDDLDKRIQRLSNPKKP